MIINLYKTSSERNLLVKTLVPYGEFEGILKQESSVITPEIMIESDSPILANYAYISSFGRYYYITNVTSVRNNIWSVKLKSDPLMSFAKDIKQSYILITDTEGYANNTYLTADNWVTNCKHFTDIISFPTGLNLQPEYILITSGGLT